MRSRPSLKRPALRWRTTTPRMATSRKRDWAESSGIPARNQGTTARPVTQGSLNALTNDSPELRIYFQLDAIWSSPNQPLRLTIDLMNLRAGTTHNFEARLNNGPAFYTIADVNSARTLTINSVTGPAGARLGPNKLTIRRTGGQLAGGSASVELDFVKLEIDRAGYFIDTFASTDWIARPGESPPRGVFHRYLQHQPIARPAGRVTGAFVAAVRSQCQSRDHSGHRQCGCSDRQWYRFARAESSPDYRHDLHARRHQRFPRAIAVGRHPNQCVGWALRARTR